MLSIVNDNLKQSTKADCFVSLYNWLILPTTYTTLCFVSVLFTTIWAKPLLANNNSFLFLFGRFIFTTTVTSSHRFRVRKTTRWAFPPFRTFRNHLCAWNNWCIHRLFFATTYATLCFVPILFTTTRAFPSFETFSNHCCFWG